jgi:small subunit ribosomal protein S21
MLFVNIKEGESIDKVLKRYKRKCDKIKLTKKFKNYKFYTKPSKKNKEKLLKAIYKQQYLDKLDK